MLSTCHLHHHLHIHIFRFCGVCCDVLDESGEDHYLPALPSFCSFLQVTDAFVAYPDAAADFVYGSHFQSGAGTGGAPVVVSHQEILQNQLDQNRNGFGVSFLHLIQQSVFQDMERVVGVVGADDHAYDDVSALKTLTHDALHHGGYVIFFLLSGDVPWEEMSGRAIIKT